MQSERGTKSSANWLLLALTLALVACLPDGEREPWEPCGEDSCGEQCRLCSPFDRDCVETAVVKMCQPDGSCSPRPPECVAANPCASVLCPRDSQCVVLDSYPPQARCVPIDACATVRCPAGTQCEAGTCVADGAAEFCGGIANISCPGAGSCVDDPTDSCDPQRGGADCGGRCVCAASGLCVEGSRWDDSPEVCGCVPDAGGAGCGDNTCAAGEFCCNASCGICAPRGGACIQIACDDEAR